MLVYVAHKYGGDAANFNSALKITHDLQVADSSNCYICPLLVFSELKYKELGYDEEMELCLDLLSACDLLYVASDTSEGVEREIEFAELIGMDIAYAEHPE